MKFNKHDPLCVKTSVPGRSLGQRKTVEAWCRAVGHCLLADANEDVARAQQCLGKAVPPEVPLPQLTPARGVKRVVAQCDARCHRLWQAFTFRTWIAPSGDTSLSASCSSGQRFAFGFLQIRSRPRHPCRLANSSPCRVSRGLSPPSECALPGAPKKTPARTGLAFFCR